MATVIEQGGSEEELDAKVKQEIQEMLDKVKALNPDAIVLFAAYGDKVVFRYIGKPAEIFNLAHQGHDHVMDSFKLEAAEPLPGQRLN